MTTLSGFTELDAHTLRLAVIKYGCGDWKNIGRHFPRKTHGQLNLQTQRLFGQQALAEFQKVHIDPSRIWKINENIEGFRKQRCLINTGLSLTREQKLEKRAANLEKFGIPPEIYEKMSVPVVADRMYRYILCTLTAVTCIT